MDKHAGEGGHGGDGDCSVAFEVGVAGVGAEDGGEVPHA